MDPEVRSGESPGSLAIGGLLTIVFGLFAVMAAIGMGWIAAAVVGVGLLVFAWKVPASSRVLPVVLGGLGAVALLGGVLRLLVGG